MELWGVEVHAQNPITLSWNNARGRRLRITQATMRMYPFMGIRIEIFCKVGERIPVLICSLIPESLPSMHIDLEFEEMEEDVVFFVGSGSVFLSGYYMSTN